MELNEKLQELRKRKGLTQEELAAALYVSRTAISKWESGRGYPSLDSLRAIASFFAVTVDDLLSGDQVLSLAQQETQQHRARVNDLVFGLLDLSVASLFFLPLFGQRVGAVLQEVTLLSLTAVAPYVRVCYLLVVALLILEGVLTLSLQNAVAPLWQRCKTAVSLSLGGVGVLLFILGSQPYAAALLFLFLVIKVCLLLKRR